jgi:hypothetical protein
MNKFILSTLLFFFICESFAVAFNSVSASSLVENTWNTKAPFMSHNAHISADLSASVVDGKIFVINQYWLCMYDPDTDTWTDKAKLPLIHGYYSESYDPVSVVVDGKIVVTSDIPDPDFRGALFYDPKTDVWSKSEIRCRIPYYGDAGVTTGLYAPQKIYVLGLLKEYGENRVYDPLSDSWFDGKRMPMSRSEFGVAVVNDVLYAIGGCTKNQAASAKNEQYIPIGYQSTHSTAKPAETAKPTEPPHLKPDFSSETFLIYLIITVVTLIAGVIVALFFYFKKMRNR